MNDRERLEEYERGFRKAGLPMFSEDFSAAEDVFNRAAPLLAIFTLLSFTTQELWEIFSTMDSAIYVVVICLFALLGSGFLIARIPKETTGWSRTPAREARRCAVSSGSTWGW